MRAADPPGALAAGLVAGAFGGRQVLRVDDAEPLVGHLLQGSRSGRTRRSPPRPPAAGRSGRTRRSPAVRSRPPWRTHDSRISEGSCARSSSSGVGPVAVRRAGAVDGDASAASVGLAPGAADGPAAARDPPRTAQAPAEPAMRSTTATSRAARTRVDATTSVARRVAVGPVVVPLAERLDAVEDHGLLDALEPARAAFHEADGRDRPDQPADGVGDEDLARPGLAAHPRGDVDRGPDEPLLGLHGLARVDADADLDGRPIRLAGVVVRRAHDRQPALDGAARRGEHDVEAVALGLDLRAAELGDLAPDDAPVPVEEGGRGRVAVRLHEPRVVAQVGEQEPVGSRRDDGLRTVGSLHHGTVPRARRPRADAGAAATRPDACHDRRVASSLPVGGNLLGAG